MRLKFYGVKPFGGSPLSGSPRSPILSRGYRSSKISLRGDQHWQVRLLRDGLFNPSNATRVRPLTCVFGPFSGAQGVRVALGEALRPRPRRVPKIAVTQRSLPVGRRSFFADSLGCASSLQRCPVRTHPLIMASAMEKFLAATRCPDRSCSTLCRFKEPVLSRSHPRLAAGVSRRSVTAQTSEPEPRLLHDACAKSISHNVLERASLA